MVMPLEDVFPGLRGTSYRVTSPADRVYNCIAWAAGVTDDWWWPHPATRAFWPAGVTRELTIAAFEQAFGSLGYVPCEAGARILRRPHPAQQPTESRGEG